jgi:hypothetical protein
MKRKMIMSEMFWGMGGIRGRCMLRCILTLCVLLEYSSHEMVVGCSTERVL